MSVLSTLTRGLGSVGIATAFRIISRFCLNPICLEELNQLCPRITGMTLVEESLEPRGQNTENSTSACPSPEHLGAPVAHRTPSLSRYRRSRPLFILPARVGVRLVHSAHRLDSVFCLGCGGMALSHSVFG